MAVTDLLLRSVVAAAARNRIVREDVHERSPITRVVISQPNDATITAL